MNINQAVACDLCHRDFPDTALVVLFETHDGDEWSPALHHVECPDCHRTHPDHLDDGPGDGVDLCGTLREFRDGTLPLGWWRCRSYYAMLEIEVEDGEDSQVWPNDVIDWDALDD